MNLKLQRVYLKPYYFIKKKLLESRRRFLIRLDKLHPKPITMVLIKA